MSFFLLIPPIPIKSQNRILGVSMLFQMPEISAMLMKRLLFGVSIEDLLRRLVRRKRVRFGVLELNFGYVVSIF